MQTPFLTFVKKIVPGGQAQEQTAYFASAVVAVYEFSAEPTFLAYRLLFEGVINEVNVLDNLSIHADLRLVFSQRDERKTGTISKQQLFFTLNTLLPGKTKEMLKELQQYLPPGGGDYQVSYGWILRDDLYIPSPLMVGVRLQHLQQVVQFYRELS